MLFALSITGCCYRQKYGPSFAEEAKAGKGKQWYFGFNAPLAKAIVASPLLLNGKLYVCSIGGTLHAIDKDKGQPVEEFQFNAGRPLKAGFRSGPVTDGELIYITCYDHNLYAVDPNNGMVLWNFTTNQKIEGAPALMGGKIYVTNWAGRVYCIDKESGREDWFYTSKTAIRCTPVGFDGKLYYGDEDGNFTCLNTGAQPNLLWEFKAGKEIYGTPVTDGDSVWFTSLDGNIYCLDADTGAQKWMFKTGEEIWAGPHLDVFALVPETSTASLEVTSDEGTIVTNPDAASGGSPVAPDAVAADAVVSDDLTLPAPDIVKRLYIGSMDAKMYFLDAETGEPATYIDGETGETVKIMPYICGQGRAFDEGIRGTATTDENYVYFGAGDFAFRALDKKTGKPVWTFTIRGDVRDKPLVYDNKVVFGCDDTYFYGLNTENGFPIRGAL